MKFKLTVFLLFCLFSVAILGCDKLKPITFRKPEIGKAILAVAAKGPVVARVNNTPVGLEDLNQEIESYNASVPADKPEAKITTREQKINYLKNEIIRRILLAQYASDKGFDRNEEVVRALEKTKTQLLVLELIKQETENVEVSSKEIEEYYNTYKEQLKKPEERQVNEICLSTEQEAKDILIQLLQGADFNTLAKERSRAASAKNGGDLGFIAKGTKSSQFDQVAFSDALDTGRISSIFKSPDGYCLIKVEAKRGGELRSLTEMWDDIKRGLTFLKQQQKIEQLIGKLSREAKIEVYEGEIK
ncbi:MAG: peptidylprolyl isomerase [Candidatus Omnitrophota bacterium]|jgi:parvulin-like peptidyl-prolyl isomerase